MNAIVAAALALLAASADAQTFTQQFPSCDLRTQHALGGDLGGSIRDPRQAHIQMRSNILQADIGSAKKAGRLTRASAGRLYRRVETVRTGADRHAARQGFLSAGEVASYDRALDAVAAKVCRR